MKLLLDENLSFRIVSSLQEAYPGTSQVRLVGLECADDRAIWQFAKENDYVVVTKDDDFQGLSGMAGHPPKVIRLLTGNSTNQAVINALLNNSNEIIATLLNENVGFIEIC
jgi:predicted nuclease of predicted toxin-antitoxin system